MGASLSQVSHGDTLEISANTRLKIIQPGGERAGAFTPPHPSVSVLGLSPGQCKSQVPPCSGRAGSRHPGAAFPMYNEVQAIGGQTGGQGKDKRVQGGLEEEQQHLLRHYFQSMASCTLRR